VVSIEAISVLALIAGILQCLCGKISSVIFSVPKNVKTERNDKKHCFTIQWNVKRYISAKRASMISVAKKAKWLFPISLSAFFSFFVHSWFLQTVIVYESFNISPASYTAVGFFLGIFGNMLGNKVSRINIETYKKIMMLFFICLIHYYTVYTISDKLTDSETYFFIITIVLISPRLWASLFYVFSVTANAREKNSSKPDLGDIALFTVTGGLSNMVSLAVTENMFF